MSLRQEYKEQDIQSNRIKRFDKKIFCFIIHQFNLKVCTFYKYFLIQSLMTSKKKHQYVRWAEQSNDEVQNSQKSQFDDFTNQAFTFSKMEQSKKVKPGIYNPKIHHKHSIVYPGLNLKGTCKNQKGKCPGFKKDVWIKKGYSQHMSLGQIIVKNICPSCNTPMKSSSFKTLGYMKARVEFRGHKVDEDEQIKFPPGQEKDGELIIFNDQQEDIVQWNYLYIKVSPI